MLFSALIFASVCLASLPESSGWGMSVFSLNASLPSWPFRQRDKASPTTAAVIFRACPNRLEYFLQSGDCRHLRYSILEWPLSVRDDSCDVLIRVTVLILWATRSGRCQVYSEELPDP